MEVSKGQLCQRVSISLEEYDGQIKPKRIRHKIRASLSFVKKVEEPVENQKNKKRYWNVCSDKRFGILKED